MLTSYVPLHLCDIERSDFKRLQIKDDLEYFPNSLFGLHILGDSNYDFYWIW